MPFHDSPRLAVIMPSYRFDPLARQSLETLAGMASDEICVHIGDNSGNPEKHAFLRQLAAHRRDVVISCHAENIGAEANWLHLVRAQHAPLICMVADDDSFSGAYLSAALGLMAADADCGAACGLLVSVAEEARGGVPALYSPEERIENDPVERIRNYNNQNAIAYAVTRTETIKSFADYVDDNPLKGAFNDYLLAFHILSTGTFQVDRSGLAYVYNNNAWHLPAAAHKARAKFYVGCGLPGEFAYLERVHWAVANAHFFRSRFRAATLDDATATRISSLLFDRMMSEFRVELKSARKAIVALLGHHRDAAEALRELLTMRYDGSGRVVDLLSRLIAPFSSELASHLVNSCSKHFFLKPWNMYPDQEFDSFGHVRKSDSLPQ